MVQGTAERMQHLIRKQIGPAARTQRRGSVTTATSTRNKVANMEQRLRLEPQEPTGSVRAEKQRHPASRSITSPASLRREDRRFHDPSWRLKRRRARRV